MQEHDPLTGEILDERARFTLAELCVHCGVHAEVVVEMVEYGVVEPEGGDQLTWRFSGLAMRRLQKALRLQRDLGVNLPGVCLSLELLDEVDRLRAMLKHLR